MFSTIIKVDIDGIIAKLTLGEGEHHCFFIKLSHLSPGYLGEFILRIRGKVCPINPFFFWNCNAKSFLGVINVTALFVNFSIKASKGSSLVNIINDRGSRAEKPLKLFSTRVVVNDTDMII